MPTVGRIGPFRFFFYSNEGAEPPHVHAQQERKACEILVGTRGSGIVGKVFCFRSSVDRAYRGGEPGAVFGGLE
jgi:hypothetical protein